MKSRTVHTVTNDEENVRLRLFDGDIPADSAASELIAALRNTIKHQATHIDLLYERSVRLTADLERTWDRRIKAALAKLYRKAYAK